MKNFIFQMVVTAFVMTLLCPSAQGSATDKDLDQEIAQKQEIIENALRVLRYYQEIVQDPDTIVINSVPVFPGTPFLITKSREGLKSGLRMAYFLYLLEKKKFFDKDEYTQWVNQTVAHYLIDGY
ncbi:MAG: hypothetical protein ABH969_00795 [Pseudomonadota bacterium]